MNADHFKGITDYPKIVHGDVEAPNLKDFAAYLKDLTGCGVIMPDEDLERLRPPDRKAPGTHGGPSVRSGSPRPAAPRSP